MVAALTGPCRDGAPVRPVNTLVMQRTLSIGTRVLPAVTRMFMSLLHGVLLKELPHGVVCGDISGGFAEERQSRNPCRPGQVCPAPSIMMSTTSAPSSPGPYVLRMTVVPSFAISGSLVTVGSLGQPSALTQALIECSTE